MKFTGKQDTKFQAEVSRVHAECLPIIEEMCKEKRPELMAVLASMEIELSGRLAVCAGSATARIKQGTAKIKLNYRLLSDNFAEIQSTYRHELAHIVASYMILGSAGHGPFWKAVALALGDDGGRCHTMDVKAYRRPQKVYFWGCACKTWQVSPRAHARYKRNEAHYGTAGRCMACKSPAVWRAQATPLSAPALETNAPEAQQEAA